MSNYCEWYRISLKKSAVRRKCTEQFASPANARPVGYNLKRPFGVDSRISSSSCRPAIHCILESFVRMKHIFQPRWNVVFLALAFAVLAVAQGSISPAQDTTERPWFERSLVGMEVGPTGAQFGYSDPEDTRYCKDWDGREIVKSRPFGVDSRTFCVKLPPGNTLHS